MPATVKICGLNDTAGLDAAIGAGAAMVGLNFFPPSPRAVTPAQAAALADRIPTHVAKVGLFVDPDDDAIHTVLDRVALDWLQLHKAAPARLAAIKSTFGLPLLAAVGIGRLEDLNDAAPLYGIADRLLIDAKPPTGSELPGGNGVAFDWQILGKAPPIRVPWLLAGGLTPDNVAEAIGQSGAAMVDVSSGVETAPGKKDPALIRSFIEAARLA